MTNTPNVSLSPRELWEQQVADAQRRLEAVAASTTQREWLLVTKALDATRQQIGADAGLTMLAMAWVKEKHEHGGASWDRLLDLVDAELEALHGFPPGDGSDLSTDRPADAAPATEPAQAPAFDDPQTGVRLVEQPPATLTQGDTVTPASGD